MDNLESLFNKKEYELVVSLVGDSLDPKERFLALSSLVILGKTDKALDDIEKYQSILEKSYLLKLMKLHFELLLSKRLFDEARIALSHYESLPYESQIVEEYMREMKDRIEEEYHSKPSSNMLNVDELLDVIENETDSGKLSNVLFSLKNYNINIYIDSLKKLLVNKNVHPNLRTYAFITLVDAKYDEDINILFRDKIIKVNPSKVKPPFLSKEFNEVCRLITFKSNKNITVAETSLHLFNCYIIDCYPEDIYKNNDLDLLADAFVCIGKKYINEDISSYDEDVKNLAKKIQRILEATPQIVL